MRAVDRGVAVMLGVSIVAGCGMSKAQADRILTEQARASGEAVMDSLKKQLVDPRAVQWGAVWANSGRICGTMNPRDSAGAYTGAKRFVGQKAGVVLVEGWSSDDFAAEWATYCTHAHILVKAGEPAGPALHPMTDDERAAEQAAFRARPIKLPPGAPAEQA